ncbi:MAG: hypothetical protein J5593_00045 [Bacteroidaceae bacterium]|nr:hypothetical protein [Bacteroidaceae bacterium]
MRKYFLIIVSVLVVAAIADKRVYIPRDLRGINLNDSTSKWSWRNSVQTEDVVFFWQQPFGPDPAKAPKLEGKPMTFDLDNVVKRVQYFYNFYRDSLHFLSTPSNADSLKMMVMINYSLEGTAYGGDYDNRVGALWVAPNRIQDRHLNCLAHELGHSFQRQITSDGAGEAWGGSGFFEMASQWMLWQVNPDWPTEENYHLQAFRKATHKAFLSPENIYRSPYVLEYWSEKRGRAHIAELFREGKRGEDPAMTYMRVNGLTQQQFCDELFDCYRCLLNFDFSHAYSQTRRHACTFSTQLDTIAAGHYRIPVNCQPEPYGFNAIKIAKTQKAKIKNIRAPKGHFLRWAIVDEPNCRYLLVMNQPERHSKLPHRGAGKEGLPTISYEVIVEE